MRNRILDVQLFNGLAAASRWFYLNGYKYSSTNGLQWRRWCQLLQLACSHSNMVVFVADLPPWSVDTRQSTIWNGVIVVITVSQTASDHQRAYDRKHSRAASAADD